MIAIQKGFKPDNSIPVSPSPNLLPIRPPEQEGGSNRHQSPRMRLPKNSVDFPDFEGPASYMIHIYIYIHIVHSLQVDLVIIDPSLGCPTKKQWPAQASRFGLTMGVKKLWCQAEVVEQNCPGCEF